MRNIIRVNAIERTIGKPENRTLVVVWPCSNVGDTKRRVIRALRRGWRLKVIRVTSTHEATNEAAANTMIAQHKASDQRDLPLKVTHSLTGETLADWNPSLPEWFGRTTGVER